MHRNTLLLPLLICAGPLLAQTPFPGNDHSYGIAASPDLRYVAFVSNASNLVPGDTNGTPDVFVIDRQSGALQRVSTDTEGLQGTRQSAWPSISADGRYVVFDTEASNLAGQPGLVRKDLQTGAVNQLAMRSGFNASYPVLSHDGAFAVSDPGGVIELHDAASGATTAVTSAGFFADAHPTISGDGRYVFFASTRSTLVAGDNNSGSDIFRWDRTNPAMGFTRVSVADDEAEGNGASPPFIPTSRPTTAARPLAVSSDGNLLVFVSEASNLTVDPAGARGGLFLRNISAGDTVKLAACSSCGILAGPPFNALDLSPDGRWLSFYADRGFEAGAPRVSFGAGYYRLDTTTLAVVALGALGSSPIVFDSRNGSAIASDGSAALLQSSALLAGDDRAQYGDVFAYVPASSTHTLLSRAAVGGPGDGHSRQASLSDDGDRVVFVSDATGLVSGDTNAQRDVFVRDVALRTTTLASTGVASAPADGPSGQPAISGDGAVVSFFSTASNLVAGDGADGDVFVRVLASGATERVSAGTGALGPSGLSRDGRYVAYAGADLNRLWLVDRSNGNRVLANPTADGQPPDESCNLCENFPLSLSDDGRYVAFNARATNQAPGQSNPAYDVFVYDRVVNAVELLSRVGLDGADGSVDCVAPTISGDGRYVAFYCDGPGNLVPGAAQSNTVFVRDRQTGINTAVGSAPRLGSFRGAEPRPLMLRDGSGVAFVSAAGTLAAGDANALPDVFVWERASGNLRLAGATAAATFPDGSSYIVEFAFGGFPRFFGLGASREGTRIAVSSAATNLANDDRNAADDVFVIESGTQAIARASAPPVLITDRDRVAPAVSANGQVAVAVRTDRNGALGSALGKGGADKWSDIAIYDFGQRRETQVDVSSNGTPADADSFNPSISPDGNQVAFASDASNLGAAPDVDPHTDIFLRDMATNTTVSITPAADGDSGKTATTQVGDKFSIAFESTATNLPGAASGNGMQDIFVAQEGAAPNSFTLEPISVGMGGVPANGPSSDPAIVPSGAMVAFASLASNLVVGDGNGVSDVFLRDRITGTNTKLSDGVGGAPADGASGAPAVAELGGGLWVAAFDSEASNLVALDLNNDTDVFVRSSTGPIELASRGMGGVPANGKSLNPALSPDGRYVTFTSTASNLVPNDTNNAPDVFVYDRNTGTTTRVSVSNSSQQADDFSLQPAIGLGAGGAPLVVFDSLAGNLAANDNDEAYDLFRASLAGGIESTDEVIFRSGFE